MPAGLYFGLGIQRLQDALQGYVRATTPVYLRERKFAPVINTQWAQVGFRIAPTGGEQTGTEDFEIMPAPSMMTMSLHNIGMSGGKLRFGAKQFLISASWVRQRQAATGVPNPKNVFDGQQVLGIVNEGMLYSIEDIQHEVAAGTITSWILVCNSNQLR